MQVNLYEKYTLKDDSWVFLAAQALEAQRMTKYWADKASELLEELKKLSGDASCHGGDFIFERIERKGSVDYSAIPELKNVDIEMYRKPVSIAWKLGKK